MIYSASTRLYTRTHAHIYIHAGATNILASISFFTGVIIILFCCLLEEAL